MSDNVKNVLVVGVGEIGREYVHVLKKMDIVPDAVCRQKEKAETFEKEEGVPTFDGGIENYLKTCEKKYDYAIVAVDIPAICDTTATLIEAGIKKIFVEKPAGTVRSQIKRIYDLANEKKADVYVAYNRRFYSSTEKALEIIQEDGGVQSFSFEFTEWVHTIANLPHSADTKENWLVANSSHVIDLAFFLGGEPVDFHAYTAGENLIDWHKHSSIYTGAGITDKGALFSYQANWGAPGRWAVEVLTPKHRLYFKPMEKLAIQEIGSVAVNPVELDDSLDMEFKPGFYKEVESFIYDIEDGKKKTIDEQMHSIEYYEKIEGRD